MTSADEPESVTPGHVPPDSQTVASLPGGGAPVLADGGPAGPEEAGSPAMAADRAGGRGTAGIRVVRCACSPWSC